MTCKQTIHLQIQVASLASATPSVAYVRFARSFTWAWWGREGMWLNSCDNIIYLMATGRTQHGNLWQCCNVHKKPPSIHHSLPPSVPACLPACWPACLPASRPTDRPTDRPTYWPTYLPIPTVPTWREGMGLSSCGNITKWLRAQAVHNTGNLWQCYNFHTKPPSLPPSLPPSIPTYLPTYLHVPTYLPTYLIAALLYLRLWRDENDHIGHWNTVCHSKKINTLIPQPQLGSLR